MKFLFIYSGLDDFVCLNVYILYKLNIFNLYNYDNWIGIFMIMNFLKSFIFIGQFVGRLSVVLFF